MSSCCTEVMLRLYSIRFPIHHQGWLVVEVEVVLEADVEGQCGAVTLSHRVQILNWLYPNLSVFLSQLAQNSLRF